MQLGAMDQLRRSRLHNLAQAARDAVSGALQKRLTPEQLSSIQAEASRSAAAQAASTAAAAQTTTSQRQGANPATLGTTLGTSRTTVPNTYTQVQAPSSSASRSASTTSSVMYPSGAASTAISTSSRSSSSIPLPSTSTYAVPIPHTITSNLPSSARSSTSSATPVATAADRVASSSGHSLSTGAVVGIVLAVLVGTVALGSLIGFLYRKMTNRGYGKSAPWSKIQDDDITPFHGNGMEKQDALVDDYYGQAAAPVIGSRRALALARQNAYDDSVQMRPQTEYYNNRAGLGAGSVGVGVGDYGGYPTMSRNAPHDAYQYGVDAQGRPYNGQAGAVPVNYNGYPSATGGRVSPPSGRQLLGPGAHPYTTAQPVELMPVPLGRPAAPNSNADLMRHEDFADELPTPMPYKYEEDSYTPRTAKSMNEWAGSAVAPNDRSRVSMPAPKGRSITPPKAYEPLPSAAAAPPSILPSLSFEPLSPLMGSFALNRQSQQLPMYEDDGARQKALYGEVAKAAGVAEPITPKTPGAGLMSSTSTGQSYNTATSFGAAEPVPRLPPPPITLTAPAPYEHGRPLSPLEEVPTPASTMTVNTAAPPYTREVNPFDRLPVPSTRTLVGSSSSSGIPSPAYPPPSPGGMSVPGSVTDSPRRWSGPQTPAAARGVGRQVSVYDEEDAYGGI